MTNLFRFFSLIMISLFGVNQVFAQDFQTTPGGLRYLLFSEGSGERLVQENDFITLDMRLQNEQGFVIQEQKGVTTKATAPVYEGDPTEIFNYLSKGDSVVVYTSVDALMQYLEQTEYPPNMPQGSDLVYIFKILNIQSQKEFEEAQVKTGKERKMTENEEIKAYLEKAGLWESATDLGDGLYYVKRQEGKGAKVAKGQTVQVHYTGMLMNGKVFDRSYDRGEPIEFRLGVGRVIKGWDNGIAGMERGEVGLLVIPSHLAYGERGAGNDIPPNSILVFEVELVDFKDE